MCSSGSIALSPQIVTPKFKVPGSEFAGMENGKLENEMKSTPGPQVAPGVGGLKRDPAGAGAAETNPSTFAVVGPCHDSGNLMTLVVPAPPSKIFWSVRNRTG